MTVTFSGSPDQQERVTKWFVTPPNAQNKKPPIARGFRFCTDRKASDDYSFASVSFFSSRTFS